MHILLLSEMVNINLSQKFIFATGVHRNIYIYIYEIFVMIIELESEKLCQKIGLSFEGIVFVNTV